MLRYYVSSYSINSVPLIDAGTHSNLYQVSRLYASVSVLLFSKDSKWGLRVLVLQNYLWAPWLIRWLGRLPGGNLCLSDSAYCLIHLSESQMRSQQNLPWNLYCIRNEAPTLQTFKDLLFLCRCSFLDVSGLLFTHLLPHPYPLTVSPTSPLLPTGVLGLLNQ